MASQPYKIAAPPDIEFELEDGKVYRVSGDPDVELVATLLEVEGQLQDAAELDADSLATTVIRGREIILQLVREKMPEVEMIRVGVSGIMQLIGLIVGNESAAQEVAELISAAAESGVGSGSPEDAEAQAAKQAEIEAGTEDAEPVPLDKPSRSSSSRSAKRTAGRRTGGKTARGASSRPSSEQRQAATG